MESIVTVARVRRVICEFLEQIPEPSRPPRERVEDVIGQIIHELDEKPCPIRCDFD